MMIMGQEYDTESANINFDEEDIDWKVMNIRMTIDKTGHKHPSWVYTPLYTKDAVPLVQPIPTKIEQLTVVEKTVVSTEEPEAVEEAAEAVEEASEAVEVAAEVVEEATEAVEEEVKQEAGSTEQPSEEIEITEDATEISEEPSSTVEYETISLNEEFDVELSNWKCNESFRLIFDPTGKIRPHIEFLIGEDVVDDVTNDAAAEEQTEPEAPVESEAVEIVETVVAVEAAEAEEEPSPVIDSEETPSTDEAVVVEVEENDEVDINESEGIKIEDQNVIVRAVVDVEKQSDEVIGSTVVTEEERFAPVNADTGCTFILPDIHQYGRDMAGFIKDELIDIHMLQILTVSGGINWWSDIKGCCKLFPLWTLRNEASLLNAVNFVLSGFNKQVQLIQGSLHEMFLNPLVNKSIKQRWSHELWLKHLTFKQPICSGDELEKRWQDVMEGSWFSYLDAVTKSENHVAQTKASYVEPVHIYMLANLLRRPIIILSEVEEKDIDENNPEKNPLTGIYLPFEQEPEKCHHYPIVLGYHRFHFSALISTDFKTNTLAKVNSPVCVPVTDAYLSLLPLHFAIYPGAEWEPYEIMDPLKIPELTDDMKVDQLVKYVHLVRVRFSKQTYDPPKEDDSLETTPSDNEDDSKHYNYLTAIRTNINRKPDDYREMVKNYANGAKKRHKSMKRNKVKCKSNGCKNIPSSQLGGVCVPCYQRTLLNNAETK